VVAALNGVEKIETKAAGLEDFQLKGRRANFLGAHDLLVMVIMSRKHTDFLVSATGFGTFFLHVPLLSKLRLQRGACLILPVPISLDVQTNV
jgi:hypothetical protein